eukprot:CAMPEP_0177598948 /NCGR_PEP_ID=MMETSP0419_2-20121207/12693_1 /TAXON_ID=582737 /ORGANISM="Tetraselmis sp., Strain GSL018" /LENGTH=1414 /DNA_ID=CAMNT_0019091571 /DNA_START=205 /DNA_END=4449 /DNA_ORIENTATION=+
MAKLILTKKLCSDLNEGKIVASDVGATITSVTDENLKQFAFELGIAVLKGDLQAPKYVVGLKASGLKDISSASTLADALWLMWLEAQEVGKEDLVKVVVDGLLKEGLMTRRVLMETCEMDFLEKTGIVQDANVCINNLIRLNTRQFYLQQKYNLFREESEGYAKVATALNGYGKCALSKDSVPALTNYLTALMGYFGLDPNRVFDTILEAFEQQLEADAYLELLSSFAYKDAAGLLGLKLEWYQKTEAKPTPQGLLNVVAALIKRGFVGMDEIYAYLSPSDEDMVALGKRADSSVRSTTGAGGKAGQGKAAGPGVTVASRKQGASAPSPANASTELVKACEEVRALDAQASGEIPADNQKLMLLQGLLEVGHWEGVARLAERLELLGIQPAAHQGAADAMRSALRRILAPECEKIATAAPLGMRLPGKGAARPPAQLPPEAVALLRLLGPRLHHDLRLFAQVVRIVRAQLASARHGEHDALRAMAAEVLAGSLLPSLSLISPNPAVVEDVWEVLRELPYMLRYQVYSSAADACEGSVLLSAVHAKLLAVATKSASELAAASTSPVADQTRKERDAVKKLTQSIAKVSHASPFAAASAIITLVGKHTGAATAGSGSAAPPLVESVIRCALFMTRLGLDVLCWSILRALARPSQAPTEADGRTAAWVVSLASLCSHLCHRFSAVDVQPMLTLCRGAVSEAQRSPAGWRGLCHQLQLLHALLETMADAPARLCLSIDDASLQASGSLLRKQLPVFKSQPTSRQRRMQQRAAARLEEAMRVNEGGAALRTAGELLQGLALAWVSLQRQRPSPAKSSGERPTRRGLQGALDRCRQAFLHVSQYLADALPADAYAELLPSVASMRELGFGHELIFHLHRPALAAYPATEDSDDEGGGSEGGRGEKSWLVDEARAMLPASCWEAISPEFFLAFWKLRLGDLHTPDERYKAEIAALKETARQPHSTRGGQAAAASRQEAEKNKEMSGKLLAELEAHRGQVRQCTRWLQMSKDTFLSNVHDRRHTVEMFQQTCIFPRIVMSPSDAIFAWKFVEKLHRIKTPNFSMVLFYDHCVKYFACILQCCTAGEARNFAVFFSEMLAFIEQLRGDSKLYASECGDSPCYLSGFASGEAVKHEKFVRLCLKWQKLLYRGIKGMLKSGDDSHMENALVFLYGLAKVPFPPIKNLQNMVRTDINSLRESVGDAVLKERAAACLKALDAVKDSQLVEDMVDYTGSSARPGPSSAGSGRPPHPLGGETPPPAAAPRSRDGVHRDDGSRGGTPPVSQMAAAPSPSTPERGRSHEPLPPRSREADGKMRAAAPAYHSRSRDPSPGGHGSGAEVEGAFGKRHREGVDEDAAGAVSKRARLEEVGTDADLDVAKGHRDRERPPREKAPGDRRRDREKDAPPRQASRSAGRRDTAGGRRH